MRLLVRTWNVFHGNADPPRRTGFLRRMVELACGDDPDVVCLQEVPVWAVRRLDDWSRMRCFGAVARRPRSPGPTGGWMTRAHLGVLRSAFAGQANAILVSRRHDARDLGHEQISEAPRERRVVHAVRIEVRGDVSSDRDTTLVVGNLHASNEFRDSAVPRAEALRGVAFLERLARPGEAVVLAGDFNVVDPLLEGYSAPGEGIDDVLVRRARAVEVAIWPRERRIVGGVVLSDHAPVDCLVELEGS
jgi:endonuclease/exonuclease/phosphatase family metal-dependent hydrolase